MKRLVIALVALAIVGGFAFADATAPVSKWTAWDYGIAFLWAQSGSSSPVAGWGPNFDLTNGNRSASGLPLNAAQMGPDNEWAFGYDGNGYGFSSALEFGLQATQGGQPGLAIGATSWQWWGAYFKPFGDYVKVTLGAPRIDYVQWTYIEGFGAYTRFINSDLSVTAEIKPIAGLTVAVADYIPANLASPLANLLGNAGQGLNFDIGNNFGLLGSYTMANMGTLTVQYKRQNAETAGSATSSNVGLGVNVSAVKDLAVNAGFNYDLVNSLATLSASTKITMFSPITVAADVAFKQVNSSTNSFAAEGDVQYAIDKYSVGVTFGYDDGNGVGLMGELASASWAGGEVYPYVQANFDNGSYLRIGFVYASGAGSGAESNSFTAVPITFLWAF